MIPLTKDMHDRSIWVAHGQCRRSSKRVQNRKSLQFSKTEKLRPLTHQDYGELAKKAADAHRALPMEERVRIHECIQQEIASRIGKPTGQWTQADTLEFNRIVDDGGGLETMKLRIDIRVDAEVVPEGSPPPSSRSVNRLRQSESPAALPPAIDVPYEKVDDKNSNPFKLDFTGFTDIPGQLSRYFRPPRAGRRTGKPLLRPILH